ncbi:21086_t:CDS:2 [Gigaspora rosea]|nr:21086_t:CDS:2 [Gigaspora rosea]
MRPVQDQITRKCDSKFTKKKRVRRKQNDKQTKNTNISTSRNDSTTFESSVETIAVGKNQRNEESMINIDPNTRSYIDSTIQASTVSMMQQLQQLLNQQAEAQSRWNAQLLETINQKLTHVNQPNSNNDNQLGTNPNNIQQENNLQRIINLNNNNGAVQGNYPPTPVNNNLILASGSEDQGNEPADKSKTIIYKATGRKFPSFVYTFKNNIQVVQAAVEYRASKLKYMSKLKAARAIITIEKPILQSFDYTIQAHPLLNAPISQEENSIIAQLDPASSI